MKIIVLSDLHIDYTRRKELSLKKESKIRELSHDAGCVLLCGDNAEISSDFANHRHLFSVLREHFACPIGFVAGNHDLWGYGNTNSKTLLESVLPAIAKEYNITSLETSNLCLENYTICGTYGHYDYTFGKIRGCITEHNFITGSAQIGNKIAQWMDKKYTDWEGRSDAEVSHELIAGLEKRIKNTKGNLIIVTHTVPAAKFIGHNGGQIEDFLGAFSGSAKLGQIILKYKPAYYFCGHTHATADGKIGSTRILNIGTDYEDWRHIILETNTGEIKKYFTQL